MTPTRFQTPEVSEQESPTLSPFTTTNAHILNLTFTQNTVQALCHEQSDKGNHFSYCNEQFSQSNTMSTHLQHQNIHLNAQYIISSYTVTIYLYGVSHSVFKYTVYTYSLCTCYCTVMHCSIYQSLTSTHLFSSCCPYSQLYAFFCAVHLKQCKFDADTHLHANSNCVTGTI